MLTKMIDLEGELNGLRTPPALDRATNNAALSTNELRQLLSWLSADLILRTLDGDLVCRGLRPLGD